MKEMDITGITDFSINYDLPTLTSTESMIYLPCNGSKLVKPKILI